MSQLVFNDVRKRFGGTEALKGVGFEVTSGEVVALLGENGAGKSTLIKILGGVYTADGGRVTIDGADYLHKSQRRTGAAQAVAFVHQDLGLIEWMTVAENVAMVNGYPRRGNRRFGAIDWAEADRRAASALFQIGCDIDPQTRVSSLSRTEKSLVAIARVIGTDCDFLVLDEPTASLPADEVETLFSAVRRLKAKGVGIIYVSHRLDEIFRIADRVVVLRDGLLAGAQPVAKTTPDELIELIVGAGTLQSFRKPQVPETRPDDEKRTVTVRNLASDHAGPVDFDIRPGEILGLVGLRGAGQEEIGRSLFGALEHSGEVRIGGEKLDLSTMRHALASGVGLVARDRAAESVAGSLSIRENVFLNPQATGRTLASVLSRRTETRRAGEVGRAVGLRPNRPELPIESLSGGNQQKVVVGRWLSTGRRLLILEDPTSGVDVGAKAEIYRLVEKAMAQGLSVLVVSTDFEEIATLCHRALVFNRGKITAELDGDALTTEAVIAAASASEAA
ncbi:sugar ABC transporter ATP-binding protein [Jiella mangrovi]|uniref:sugar ABC transporter ATP-binding protein n=1 Tax=Jiella mangrovi TaxID=2821407 RepID=UPI0031583839